MQYIFDINAWGKLAGMPAALASTAIFLTTIAPLSEPVRGRRLWSLAAAISLIVGSLVYLYPEMLPVYGAGVIAAIAAWAWLNRGRRTFDWLRTSLLKGMSRDRENSIIGATGVFLRAALAMVFTP